MSFPMMALLGMYFGPPLMYDMLLLGWGGSEVMLLVSKYCTGVRDHGMIWTRDIHGKHCTVGLK